MRFGRLVSLSFLSAGVFLGAVLAPGCSSQPPAQVTKAEKPARPSEQAKNYLEDARTELKAKNFSAARAMIDLAHDEGIAEKDARPLLAELERGLAQKAESEGELQEAHEQYIKAAEQEDEHERATEDLLKAIDLGQQIGMMSPELAPIASRAVELTVQSTDAQRLAARLWDDAGEPERALSYYQWLYKVDPDDVGSTSRMGRLLLNQGDIVSARRIFEALYRAQPEHPVIALQLAEIYAKLARYTDTERIYNKLLQENPENTAILKRYTQFLKSRGHYDRAAIIEADLRMTEPPIERRKMRPLR